MTDTGYDPLPVHFDNGERFGTSVEMIAEIRKLREVLAPFASIKPTVLGANMEAVHYWCVIGTPDRTSFTGDDLRRAREALSPTKDKSK